MATNTKKWKIVENNVTPEKVTTDSMHKMFPWNYFYANWKRKTSVAKVRLYKKWWDWTIIINWINATKALVPELLDKIKTPLWLTWFESTFNITVKVSWWWKISQTDAIRHWIAKALIVFNPELKATLKKEGHLTRDSREKERKKPWLKRARKAPTWVKR